MFALLCRNGIIKYSQGPHGTRQYWVNLEASGRNKLKVCRKNTTTIPDAKVGVNGQIKLPKPTKMETFTTMDEDNQPVFVGSNHVH